VGVTTRGPSIIRHVSRTIRVMDALPTDALLVAAFAAGDGDAVGTLFSRYAADLRRYFLARCGDREQADEMAQEVAARLVTAAPRLDSERNTRGYLFRTAQNVWRDHLRQQLFRRGAHARLAREESREVPAADSAVLERELLAALRHAVALLPPPQREVLELRHREGITFREIAERLNRPMGTVLAQMRAGLKSIGNALENYR